MKKLLVFYLAALITFAAVQIVDAATYSFEAPWCLTKMVPKLSYEWGINWELPQDESIVGASLVFEDIHHLFKHDLVQMPNILYSNLYESARPGASFGRDTLPGNDFDGIGTELFEWHDVVLHEPQDMVYMFDSSQLDALSAYLGDGNFGMGFDPERHFFSSNVTLVLETAYVPVPPTLILLCSGIIGLFGLRRKEKGNSMRVF